MVQDCLHEAKDLLVIKSDGRFFKIGSLSHGAQDYLQLDHQLAQLGPIELILLVELQNAIALSFVLFFSPVLIPGAGEQDLAGRAFPPVKNIGCGKHSLLAVSESQSVLTSLVEADNGVESQNELYMGLGRGTVLGDFRVSDLV